MSWFTGEHSEGNSYNLFNWNFIDGNRVKNTFRERERERAFYGGSIKNGSMTEVNVLELRKFRRKVQEIINNRKFRVDTIATVLLLG